MQRPYNGIHPSKAALIEHIRHDIHGGDRYASRVTLPSPSSCGWDKASGV